MGIPKTVAEGEYVWTAQGSGTNTDLLGVSAADAGDVWASGWILNGDGSDLIDRSPIEVFGGSVIEERIVGLLPTTLGSKSIAVSSESSGLSQSDRYILNICLNNEGWETALQNVEGLSIINYLSTDADREIVLDYGLVSTTPTYLLSVKPSIYLEGTTVFQGPQIPLGTDCLMSISVSSPSGMINRTQSNITAAGTYSITFDKGKKRPIRPSELTEEEIFQLPAYEYSSYIQRTLGSVYFSLCDQFLRSSFVQLHARLIGDISWGTVFASYEINHCFNVPISMKSTALSIDVQNISSIFATKDNTSSCSFQVLTGFIASYLEEYIFDFLLNSNAVSTTTIFSDPMLCNSYNLFMKDTPEMVWSLNTLNETAKHSIRRDVNQGNIIIAPSTEIVIEDSRYSGWISIDPEGKAAGYYITTGLAGASTTNNKEFPSDYPEENLCEGFSEEVALEEASLDECCINLGLGSIIIDRIKKGIKDALDPAGVFGVYYEMFKGGFSPEELMLMVGVSTMLPFIWLLVDYLKPTMDSAIAALQSSSVPFRIAGALVAGVAMEALRRCIKWAMSLLKENIKKMPEIFGE